MPLRTYLQQQLPCVDETVVLIVDNARSPLLPCSKPDSPRCRTKTLRRTLKRRSLCQKPDTVCRWELPENKDHHHVVCKSLTERHLVDTAFKLPTRTFSCDFTDDMLNGVFSALITDDEILSDVQSTTSNTSSNSSYTSSTSSSNGSIVS
jgi:hypothetical protein